MYVVMGATGNTGGVVAGKLLAAGKKVRAIGRSAHRLEKLAKQGAEAAVADAADPSSLGEAFAGASAAYVLVPPNIASPDIRAYQARVTDSIASALKANAVSHVVVLSSFGADKTEKTGPVIGLHQLEKRNSRQISFPACMRYLFAPVILWRTCSHKRTSSNLSEIWQALWKTICRFP